MSPGPGEGSTAPGSGGGLDAALGPYLGVWPYATWSEVRDHVERQDPSFTTPEDTARRFAEEVVGLRGPLLGTQRVARDDAFIEVRSPQGTTTLVLTRPDLGEGVDPPWGVVSASGDLALTAGPAGPGRVDAEVRGPGPSVVALDDRVGWRGVARTVDGAASVRVDPGPAVPAAVVAVAGDPRSPSSFAVQRVDIGPGSPAPDPPADPRVAAADLAAGFAAGDVAGIWNGLDDAARRSVLDWRGLVGRWDALAEQVAPFGGDAVAVTRITGPDGPVDVVSSPLPDGGAVASVFRPAPRGSLLASLTTPSLRWDLSAGQPSTLTARGLARPSALVLDGGVRSGEVTGDGGLTVPLTDLAPGPHVAVAVFLGEEVSAGATVVTTAEVEIAEEEPPAPPGPSDPPHPVPAEPPTSTTTAPTDPDPAPGRTTQPPPADTTAPS